MADDADLLDAWKQGDREAATKLFNRYFSAVARFFANKLSSDSDDLVQKTFEALVNGRDRIQSSRSFRSYLFGIAHNILRAHLRTLAREQIDWTTTTLHDLGLTAELLVVEREEERLLLQGLRRIPIESQTLLELYYWENLSVGELAQALETRPGTIKSRLHRARKQLKAALARLARSRALLDSTITRLDDWARHLRHGFQERRT